MRGQKRLDVLLSLTLALVISSCHAATIRVARVIDGDTFETESGEKVRMIGINAPEASDVNGTEATRHLEVLIEGKDVVLVADAISNDRDRYQRLLRYVQIDGHDMNLQMIHDGFAFAYLKYKFTRSKEYHVAQIEAMGRHMGMWGGATSKQMPQEVEDISNPTLAKTYVLVGLFLALICVLIWTMLKR